jgi:hypothetical protein
LYVYFSVCLLSFLPFNSSLFVLHFSLSPFLTFILSSFPLSLETKFERTFNVTFMSFSLIVSLLLFSFFLFLSFSFPYFQSFLISLYPPFPTSTSISISLSFSLPLPSLSRKTGGCLIRRIL